VFWHNNGIGDTLSADCSTIYVSRRDGDRGHVAPWPARYAAEPSLLSNRNVLAQFEGVVARCTWPSSQNPGRRSPAINLISSRRHASKGDCTQREKFDNGWDFQFQISKEENNVSNFSV